MVFLAPDFVIGRLSAIKGLSLSLRADRYGHDFIISEDEGGMIAVMLGHGSKHDFVCFSTKDAHSHTGIVIDGVRIEVDVDLDPSREFGGNRFGAVVRKGEGLYLICRPDNTFRGVGHHVQLASGLPKCDDSLSAVFTKWAVVKGEGRNKKILYEVDVSCGEET